MHLGIRHNRIISLNNPNMRDGFDKDWKVTDIEREIDVVVKEHGIKQIITFDSLGVSAHPNHIACYNGTVYVEYYL